MGCARYDLVVIGSGPAGQKGAIAAAKIGKRVAIIDRARMLGGVCIHTGTIPSKTLREAILYLSGLRQRAFYGKSYTVKEGITVTDLSTRVGLVMGREVEVVRAQLKRNGITVIEGAARFTDPHTVEVETPQGCTAVAGEYILVAPGTRPAKTPDIPFDGRRIVDSDGLLGIEALPRNVIVVGAGVVGIEYACMLLALNVEVTIIDGRREILEFADEEIVDALCYRMRAQNATFRLGERVESVTVDDRDRIVARLESGKRVIGDGLLYTVGRQGNTEELNLSAVDGLCADERGRLRVNERYQTCVPHIYAAGDVIGFPSLASAAMEQGRLASCYMFGMSTAARPELFPYGIYTIPEISMVGRTERQLTESRVTYEVGVARFDELAKGQMMGEEMGLLKLLFDPDDHRLLGVHIIGDGAAELAHIGQAILSFGGTIDYFRDTVFNYPTLAEAYKVAALDGLNKL